MIVSSIPTETIEVIKGKTPGLLQEVWVEDLVIGLFFTGVKLSTGHADVGSGIPRTEVEAAYLQGATVADGGWRLQLKP